MIFLWGYIASAYCLFGHHKKPDVPKYKDHDHVDRYIKEGMEHIEKIDKLEHDKHSGYNHTRQFDQSHHVMRNHEKNFR